MTGANKRSWLNEKEGASVVTKRPVTSPGFKNRNEPARSLTPTNDVESSDISTDTDWWETETILPFEPCSTMCVSGPTGVGKTRWVYRLLKRLKGMYVKDPPRKIMYCYGVYQPLFDDMEKTLLNFTLHAGLPTQLEMEEFADGEHGLIVLDDLMQRVVERTDMELLFTQGCHHRRLSVIFITQNLYGKGKSARTITLNTWYLIVFKNARDASQMQTLGKQLYPGNGRILTESYTDATKTLYGYLVIDTSPHADDRYRLRTNIFPGEDMIVYVPEQTL
jgi:hypothetical protein